VRARVFLHLALAALLGLSGTATSAPQVVGIEGRPLVRLTVRDGNDIRFARITRSQGLSQTRVDKIVQDDLGFIWFGTQYGLNRYDGYHFKVFANDNEDPQSLGGVDIFSLFKDHSGTLWVGCAHSLDRFDAKTSTFEHFHIEQSAQLSESDVTVRHISEDPAGTLWLSTGTGLYSLNPVTRKTTRFRHDPADPDSLASDHIKFTGTDRRGQFWVADNGGLEQFDPKTHKVLLRIPIPESRDLSFYEDRNGTFWVLYASGNGITRFDRDTHQLTRYTFNNEASPGGPLTGTIGMIEDHNGTLWVGTLSDGLLKFDTRNLTAIRYRNHPEDPESLAENRITRLYEDRGGNIWTGLGASEPNLFATRQPGFEPLPPDPDSGPNLGEALVNCLYEDHKGYLWVGMTGALKRLDRKTGHYTHYAIPGAGTDVISLIEDSQGFMWLGTSGQGLHRLDPETGQVTRSFRHDPADPTSLSNDVVQRLFLDHTGTLWAATWEGFNRFDAARGQFKTYLSNANDRNEATPIAEDRSGHLWLGTVFSGLVSFDPVTEQLQAFEYRPSPGAAGTGSDKTNSLYIEGPESIWSGTQNGLYRLNPRTGATRAWFTEDGLPSNAISCILADAHRNLWISTNRGVAKFSPGTGMFKHYSVGDGLPGQDLTGWWACFKSPSGEMFFGGFHGATAFFPDRIVDDTYVPPIVLTRFQLSGAGIDPRRALLLDRSIAYATERTLPFNENSFSIEFSALSFRSPGTNRYRYQLQGLDSNWHEAESDRRVASYTTLPPGNYEFRVQGATSSGPWSEPVSCCTSRSCRRGG
jgi:ligand-binding sensor domain-containing protein